MKKSTNVYILFIPSGMWVKSILKVTDSTITVSDKPVKWRRDKAEFMICGLDESEFQILTRNEMIDKVYELKTLEIISKAFGS